MNIKQLTIAAIFAAVAGCSEIGGPTTDIADKPRFGAGDALDVGTTAVALSSGFVEANPILASCGPAAPVCAAVGKPALKYALVEAGVDPADANIGIEQASWMGGCANIATMMAIAPPAAIAFGLGCGLGYLGSEGIIKSHKRTGPSNALDKE